MNFLIPGVALAALVLAPKKKKLALPSTPKQEPPQDAVSDYTPMELAELAAKTAISDGEHPEEAEIDAFETYLLNGGRDVFSFSESISVDNDKKNPTLERWQPMTPEAIEEELRIETSLSDDDIVIVVNNYLRGARRSEGVSGTIGAYGGTGKRFWAKTILVGGWYVYVLGPLAIPGILLGNAVSLAYRDKKINGIVLDLMKDARSTGAEVVILPSNLQDNSIGQEIASRLKKNGFDVKFTGPSK